MKYLVLHTFRSFGRTLRKGEVVDESAIRSPRLRLSERKIVPAVEEPLNSAVTTAGEATPAVEEPLNSAVISSGETEQQVVAAPVAQPAPPNEDSPKQVRLSFKQ